MTASGADDAKVAVSLDLTAWTLLASAAEVMAETVGRERGEQLTAVAKEIDRQVWNQLAPGATAAHS